MKLQRATLFAVLSGSAMFAAVVIGLIVIGSPRELRMRRLDQTRADDLLVISGAIRSYRLTHDNLPQKLDELQGLQQAIYRLKDPVGRPYEYTVKDTFSYELCAEFDTATDATTAVHLVFEKHGQGRQCFTQEARPPATR